MTDFNLTALPDQPEKQQAPPGFDLSKLPDQPTIEDQHATIGIAPDLSDRYHEAVKNSTGPWDYLDRVMGFGWGEAVRRVKSWGVAEGPEGAAKAQNIMALSHLYHVSAPFAADNYDELNRQAGLNQYPSTQAVVGAAAAFPMMIAAAPELGGLTLIRMALGFAGYEAEEEGNRYIRSRIEQTPFLKTKPYSLSDLTGPQSSDITKLGLGLLDIYGKGAILAGGFYGLRAGWDNLTIETFTKNGLPQKFYVSPDQVRDVFRGTAGPDDMEVWRALNVSADELRESIQGGFQVELPVKNLMTVQDRPWWGKLKTLLNISPYSETTETVTGERKFTPVAGLLGETGEAPAVKAGGIITKDITKTPESSIKPEISPIPTREVAPGPAISPPPISEQGPVNDAMTFFQSKGWTKEQAAGIVGNLMHESGMDPNIHERGGGPGFGLAQWSSPERQRALSDYAHSKGENTPSLQTQLEFVQRELETSEGAAAQALRSAKTPQEAAKIFSDTFERPGVPAIENRQKLAQAAYEGTTATAARTGTTGISRNDWVEAINRNANIPQEQREAFISMADAAAGSWAKSEGRDPEEWFPTYLAGVEGGEAPEEVAVPETVPKAKEPWEMTRQEFAASTEAKNFPITKEVDIPHRAAIEHALSEGKPVPEEVLKDYPDLAAKGGEAPRQIKEGKRLERLCLDKYMRVRNMDAGEILEEIDK